MASTQRIAKKPSGWLHRVTASAWQSMSACRFYRPGTTISIGFLIALIPPVLMAYAQYGLQTALIVLIGYILINGGVQNFIQPKMMGQSLRISPVVVFVGLFVWGYLLGGIGAILAVPMTMLVLIIMENFEGTRPLAILMRYTGEEKKEERQEAANVMKGLWGKVRGTFKSERETKEIVDESSED